jgi:parvulin-like peptidyl-prolyl isomerase
MLLLIGFVLLVTAVVDSTERVMVEGILVRVNDRIMTVTDFVDRLQGELSQMQPQPTGDQLVEYTREAFDTAVDEMVILERAREKKLTIDDEMIDSAMDELREQNDLQDETAFEAALAGSGLTEDMLRERYRHNMLLQRTVQSEIKPTEITEEEIRQRYEADKEQYSVPAKVELEQVFFPVGSNGSDRDRVLRVANGLVERVRAGNDLRAEATLAGAEIQELGEIPQADLRQVVQDALSGLEEGGLSDPVDTTGGFLVIRLIRRIPAGYQPFEEVKEPIRRQLSAEAYKDQTQGMVERLKEDYLVKVHEDRYEVLLTELLAYVGSS